MFHASLSRPQKLDTKHLLPERLHLMLGDFDRQHPTIATTTSSQAVPCCFNVAVHFMWQDSQCGKTVDMTYLAVVQLSGADPPRLVRRG